MTSSSEMQRAHVQRPQTRGRRLLAGAAAVVVIVSGLVVHAADTGPVTNFGADALYAALVYLCIAVVAPRWRPVLVGAVAASLCLAVELFQLTGIPAALSDSWVFRLTLGTSFALSDLIAYVVGIAMVGCCDVVVNHALTRRRARIVAGASRYTTRRQLS